MRNNNNNYFTEFLGGLKMMMFKTYRYRKKIMVGRREKGWDTG